MEGPQEPKRGAWKPLLAFVVMLVILLAAIWLLRPEPGATCFG